MAVQKSTRDGCDILRISSPPDKGSGILEIIPNGQVPTRATVEIIQDAGHIAAFLKSHLPREMIFYIMACLRRD